MDATMKLMFEAMVTRRDRGQSPSGGLLQGFLTQVRSRPPEPSPAPPRSGGGVWRTFEDVVALNEALDDEAFIGEWRAATKAEARPVAVTGTLYPYEPICAGSARMWRTYWLQMQQALLLRLGPAAAEASIGRAQKVRDWFTQSLFLWGFSMAHPPEPAGGRWLGIGSMDEINGIPVLLGPDVWEQVGSRLFAGRERAWDVRLTGYLERRAPATAAPGALGTAFKALEREYFLRVVSPDHVTILAKSVFFSAYVWGLFETPQGDAYALWEHANIADHELFDEGTARLARKARDLSGPGDQLAAALAPEVAAAVGGTRP